MTQTATVIGSGISGPMASIVLAKNGYRVHVYEARPAEDLHSDGILGITPENWGQLQRLGAGVDNVSLPNLFTDSESGATYESEYHYITWTDLHNSLTDVAVANNVQFHYAVPIHSDDIESDVVIRATGVGSAREVSTPRYTGYVIIRGLAYQFARTSWVTLGGKYNGYEFDLKIGDTRDGASVTLFAFREHPQMRTTYSAVAPGEINAVDAQWRRVLETVPLWQTAPMSDWSVPGQMVYRGHGAVEVRIGDSNGQMRPQTSMGANLALGEAMALPELLGHDSARQLEQELLYRRQQYYAIGALSGI